MTRLRDLTGQKFARLSVIGRAPNGVRVQWHCVCDCGASLIVTGDRLVTGNTKSCGCLKRESARTVPLTHGHSRIGHRSLTWQAWVGMRKRCSNPNNRDYAYYGGRGITVCERWQNFANFLADMGEKPEGTSLDRIDNDRGYEPSNCRWATISEQRKNRRPWGHKLKHGADGRFEQPA